jgi:protein TonB
MRGARALRRGLTVAASAAAHAAVLAATLVGPEREVSSTARPVLVFLTPPVEGPAAPPRAREPDAAVEPRGPARRAEPDRAAVQAAGSAPATPVEAAQAPVVPVAPDAVPQPAAAAPMQDPERQYAAEVWRRLAEHPPSGPAGRRVATVAFELDREGRLTDLRLARSSGLVAFDRACLAAVRAAAPFPRPPAQVRDLSFTVPIRAPESAPVG